MGVPWNIPRCPERVPRVFRDIPEVFRGRGGSGPVLVFTDTPLFLKAFSFFIAAKKTLVSLVVSEMPRPEWLHVCSAFLAVNIMIS